MSLQPVQQEQVQQTMQIVLSVLDDDQVRVPASLAEGIVSAKSLIRALVAGNLIVCQSTPDKAPGVQVTKGTGPGPAVIEEDMPQELKDAILAKQAEEAEEEAPKSLGALIDEEEAKAVEEAGEAA